MYDILHICPFQKNNKYYNINMIKQLLLPYTNIHYISPYVQYINKILEDGVTFYTSKSLFNNEYTILVIIVK